MNLSLFSLALVQSALLALGQVMLKLALLRMDPFSWNLSFWRSLLLNWHVMDVYHQALPSERSLPAGQPKLRVRNDSCHNFLPRTCGLD